MNDAVPDDRASAHQGLAAHSYGGQATSERLLRLSEVIERVGLKRTAIYQRMREGRFPQSRSLGSRCTVWVKTEIDAWIDEIAG